MTARPDARTTTAAVVVAFCLAATVTVAAPAQGAYTKLTVTTAERPLDVPLPPDVQVEPYSGFNQGWWNEVGHDWDGYDNPNYSTGWSDYYGATRGFFSFHLGRVQRPVVKAVLRMQRGCATSADPVERLALWDVTSDPAALNRGEPAAGIFRDLGGGRSYGGADISTAPGQSEFMRMQLNPAALAEINRIRARNRYFSVGATLTSTTGTRDETVWGCTGREPAELLLTLR